MAAYLLAVLGGKEILLKRTYHLLVLRLIAKVKKVIGELNGNKIFDIIEEGKMKLASMQSGGAPDAAAVAGSLCTRSKERREKGEVCVREMMTIWAMAYSTKEVNMLHFLEYSNRSQKFNFNIFIFVKINFIV